MAEKKKSNEPLVHSVWVECPAAEAFRFFTEGFAEWWPLQAHSLHKEEAERCAIEPWRGGRVFERTRDGREEEWGTVVAWEPPGRLEFTWCPGRREDGGETVRVDFRTEAGGTRVTLVHQGWSRAGSPVCALGTPQWTAILTRSFGAALRQGLVLV